MKKLAFLLLLTGCAAQYSKTEIDDRVNKIVSGVNDTYALALATAKKAFAVEIAKCNKEQKIYDVQNGTCVEKKEPTK